MIEVIVTLGRVRDTAYAETPEDAVYAARMLMNEQKDHASRGSKPQAFFVGPDGVLIAGPLGRRDLTR